MDKILVVEDNDDVRDNLQEILELSGYSVITASNGKIGVDMAINQAPDLIICDVMMPQLDGFGVLKILSKHETAFQIPLIFLTAKTEKQDYRKGMGLGASDFITKPFDDTELLEAIETRLSLSKRSKSSVERMSQKAFHKSIRIITDLFANGEVRKYFPGQKIFEFDRNANFIYLLKEGLVKIEKTNDQGKSIITKILGSSDLFGYEFIWLGSKYDCDAWAMMPSIISQIPKSEFEDAIKEGKIHVDYLMSFELNQKRSNDQRLLEMAYGSLRKKIANSLLRLGEKIHGDQLKDTDSIQVTREDLSNISGSAIESTIRTLSDFKTEGLITILKDEIQLCSIKKLKSVGIS